MKDVVPKAIPGSGSPLPDVTRIVGPPVSGKERAANALRLLRQAAIASRQPKGQPFFSIRAAAAHFALPPTTVTRLYGQLKKEGILGSIWGSKTIVEPAQLDNDVRLKGIVAIPIPLRACSAISAPRFFLGRMQRALARERFGSVVIFYDEATFGTSSVTEALLESGAHMVIWLMPPQRAENCLARLKDHAMKSLVITDEMPINGEPGYYLNWRNAVLAALASWKLSGIRKLVLVKDVQSSNANTLRSLSALLCKTSFTVESREATDLRSGAGEPGLGIIFSSVQSLVEFTHAATFSPKPILQHNRVLFIHGDVDIPYQDRFNRCFDTINFNWHSVARRIASDLVASRWAPDIERQTIFEAQWKAAPSTPLPGDIGGQHVSVV